MKNFRLISILLISALFSFKNAYADSDYSAVLPFYGSLSISSSTDDDRIYFTAPYTGYFDFYSTGSTDVIGYIYDTATITLIASNDDGNGYPNFYMSVYLYSGVQYYLKVSGVFSSSTGPYNVYGDFGYAASSYNTVSCTYNCGGSDTSSGCSLGSKPGAIDPTLPLLAVIALIGIFRKKILAIVNK